VSNRVSNRYRVPKKAWRKWPASGRRVFNELYAVMIQNPGLFQHTRAPKPTRSNWKVTAWNAAWIAADSIATMTPLAALSTNRQGKVVA